MRTRITLSLTTAEADALLFVVNMGSADIDALNENELKGYGLNQQTLDAMTRGHQKLGAYVGARRRREQERKQRK